MGTEASANSIIYYSNKDTRAFKFQATQPLRMTSLVSGKFEENKINPPSHVTIMSEAVKQS
eukprot:3722556-Amphidinium_carterae.2